MFNFDRSNAALFSSSFCMVGENNFFHGDNV